MELSRRLTALADATPEIHQYAMKKYAQSFEIIPITLSEVSGHNATNVITSLMADHQKGKPTYGVDIENGSTKDMVSAEILDSYLAKYWAIRFATDAAINVLKVDQIIMAKPSGGPKPRDQPIDGDDAP
jgi:T-complex protein 1 subunit theta